MKKSTEKKHHEIPRVVWLVAVVALVFLVSSI